MSRKWFIFLALCAIGAIVAYRMYGEKFNWPLFFSTIRNIHWGWLAASIVITILTFLFRAFRWQVLIGPIKHIDIGSLFTTTLMGFTSIFLLGRAGELVRPLWLARREKVSVSASFATIIIERFIDSMMLIGLFSIALLTVSVSSESASTLMAMKSAAWYIVAFSAGAIVFFFFFRTHVDLVASFIPFPKIAAQVKHFGHGLAFLQDGRRFAGVLLHSVVLWMLIALQAWLAMRAVNIDMPLAATTLVMVGAAIGSVAQIPGIGGGFQAGFAFCMTTFFRFPPETAISAAEWRSFRPTSRPPR
jgi:uncharacterized protein (TIRG00374 family)